MVSEGKHVRFNISDSINPSSRNTSTVDVDKESRKLFVEKFYISKFTKRGGSNLSISQTFPIQHRTSSSSLLSPTVRASSSSESSTAAAMDYYTFEPRISRSKSVADSVSGMICLLPLHFVSFFIVA
ncbi:unnamed protein product [Enterobius vermicularis]|uniref:Uncharacterized protein n=1 Tax=Enterobius vermicularis TaxID=51028 RepID=A0A0N4V9A7_ENTVE|nr:unnamed protein product [Enterobius vermicularis]